MAKKRPSTALNDWKLTMSNRRNKVDAYFTSKKAMEAYIYRSVEIGSTVTIKKGRFKLVKKYKIK